MTAGEPRPDRVAPAPTPPWRRLHWRVLALHGLRLAIALAPVAVVLALGGELDRGVAISLGALFGGRALAVAADALRWRTTRYRIGPDRVELRSGLVRRSDRAVPRDRIRTVDVTATPLQRLLGLAVVRVGTGRRGGDGDGGGLALDAVATAEAETLRRELLGRAATRSHAVAPAPRGATADAWIATVGADAPDADAPARADDALEPLARLRWRWLPYDLLSPWTLALPVIAAGAAIQLLDAFGVESIAFATVLDNAERVEALPLPAALALAVLVLAVVGTVAAAALFVESWWGFSLTRERSPQAEPADAAPTAAPPSRPGATAPAEQPTTAPPSYAPTDAARAARPAGAPPSPAPSDGRGDALHLRRGLLTRRSLTIEQRRLRGVELVEPLPLWLAGGAALHALATGLRGDRGGQGPRTDALLPRVPRADAHAVAARVLRTPALPDRLARLVPHPPAARRRRWLRAVGAVAAIAAALALASAVGAAPPAWAWPLALVVAVPVAALLAHAAARALASAVTERFLITRHGAVIRRTVVLERDGVIGWTARSTPLQRRAGLVTLTATTAAGRGGYRVIDVDERDGLALVERTTPGTLAPFLERSASTSGASAP